MLECLRYIIEPQNQNGKAGEEEAGSLGKILSSVLHTLILRFLWVILEELQNGHLASRAEVQERGVGWHWLWPHGGQGFRQRQNVSRGWQRAESRTPGNIVIQEPAGGSKGSSGEQLPEKCKPVPNQCCKNSKLNQCECLMDDGELKFGLYDR